MISIDQTLRGDRSIAGAIRLERSPKFHSTEQFEVAFTLNQHNTAKRTGDALSWKDVERAISELELVAVVSRYSDVRDWSSRMLQRDLEREVIALDDLIPK